MEATGRRLRPPASLPGPLQHLLPCSSCASWQRARTGSLRKDKHTALRSTSSSRRARGPCSLAWPAATEMPTPQPEMLSPQPRSSLGPRRPTGAAPRFGGGAVWPRQGPCRGQRSLSCPLGPLLSLPRPLRATPHSLFAGIGSPRWGSSESGGGRGGRLHRAGLVNLALKDGGAPPCGRKERGARVGTVLRQALHRHLPTYHPRLLGRGGGSGSLGLFLPSPQRCSPRPRVPPPPHLPPLPPQEGPWATRTGVPSRPPS